MNQWTNRLITQSVGSEKAFNGDRTVIGFLIVWISLHGDPQEETHSKLDLVIHSTWSHRDFFYDFV